MIVSVNWLKDYVDVPEDLDALAERLTLSGTEVERTLTQDAAFEGIVVAQVTALRPHPNADKLLLATVTTGETTVEVVTGARNLAVGDRVPLARAGARLGARRIEAQSFRGIRSEGMLCSAAELGLGEDASGILVLDSSAPLGTDLRSLYPPDTLLHLEVKSNRPDLLAHLGVAREIAALFRLPLRRPSAGGEGVPQEPFVTIEAPEGCRRFVARVVSGVRVQPSPAWLQARLRAAGVRPISNVVDVTNYVMLELGQPMHAFDRARLRDGRLIVRRARAGEQLECLDGRTRTLDPEFMVVADPAGPQGLAGIIGGAASAVSAQTQEVVLEAATWEPRRIRATARALGLRTEASLRFEKGLSPALSLPAVDRAATLLEDLAGGRATGGTDVYPDRYEPRPIELTMPRLNRTLGVDVPPAEATEILNRLDFKVDLERDRLIATPPDFRLDCAIPEDVVEEVGRIYGFNRIPSTLPGSRRPVSEIYQPDDVDDRVRDVLNGLGFDEAISYPIVDRRRALDSRLPGASDHPAEISNPVAEDRNALRVSLIPSLLEALARNARQDQPGARLFEIGTGFWPLEDAAEGVGEPRLLSAAVHVPVAQASAAAAELRTVLAGLRLLAQRIGGRTIEIHPGRGDGLHPGRTAHLLSRGRLVGIAGEVHPALLGGLDLPGRAVVAEVVLDALVGDGRFSTRAVAVPRYPGVRRDLTVVVKGRLEASRILQVIRELGGYTLREVSMLSEYVGPQLGPDTRSLSFRLYYQADDRTLTGEEVARLHERIVSGLAARFPQVRG
ncbi:MAG TPA: phenylalanine--tRNA ligase subunit beta [Candidatus Limnocylindrales bacterium]|nr:phenylalanine--tRNA ligase subunit beta [Candidatus Limnocylindrales bacterium]